MAGVLSGIRVLDLTWGISGPLATMLLSDQGADVIKIEPKGGDPFRSQLGYKTWQRGKRSAELDLHDADDLEAFMVLAAHADVLVESFTPGVTERLGIDYATLSALNPRLVYASITGYGRDNEYSDRPGYDLLVAARSGLNWEHRGWPEGCVLHMSRRPDPLEGFDVPYSMLQGPARPGPMTTGAPAASVGAFYALYTGINAALLARETTGRGQWVETSLFQGAGAAASSAWQRAENPDFEGYNTWIKASKSPKGHFQCKDDRWVHQWVMNPRFVLEASEGDEINCSPNLSVQNDPNRFGTGMEEIVAIVHYTPILAERMKKFTSGDWIKAAAAADVPTQEVRSPEAALADPLLLEDGCVREIDDPELGVIRQVGTVIELSETPGQPGGPAPYAGQHNDEVRAEARALRNKPAAPAGPGATLSHPLAGVRVLDMGLAVAGPFCCQVLADLGADVIKVNAFHDFYFQKNHISMACNRGKRSLCVDLKTGEGMEVLRKLVATADVVMHNMRYDAAIRLGVDYESLKTIKPDLIYCHTRGNERGPREKLPANDQMGACLAGVQYEDGGMSDGGKPFWSLTSFGDTGNGFLAANGILNALYHRKRTGEGQFVSTAIVNAQLLNISHVLARPDGSGFDRPRLDGEQTGIAALYSLYETADGWIAIAAVTDEAWAALQDTLDLPELRGERFATKEARYTNDKALRTILREAFRSRTAIQWRDQFDSVEVPCEVSDPTFGQNVYDKAWMRERGWTVSHRQPLVGQFDQFGRIIDFSETPGIIQGPPIVLGDSTAQILDELGYGAEQVERMHEAKIVGVWSEGQPLLEGPRRFMGLKPSTYEKAEETPGEVVNSGEPVAAK